MPAYNFLCAPCNIVFERLVPLDTPVHPCPECQSASPRHLEGQTFSHTFEEPANPTNSGIHAYENPSADMAVGRDAEKKWADYAEKKKVKDALREKHGPHLARVSSDPHGYTPLSKEAYRKRVQDGKAAVRAYNRENTQEKTPQR